MKICPKCKVNSRALYTSGKYDTYCLKCKLENTRDRKHFYVYSITNSMNGIIYYGSTKRSDRWAAHKANHNREGFSGYTSPLYTAMREFGIDAFVFNILQYTESREVAYMVEKQLIEESKNQNRAIYNVKK